MPVVTQQQAHVEELRMDIHLDEGKVIASWSVLDQVTDKKLVTSVYLPITSISQASVLGSEQHPERAADAYLWSTNLKENNTCKIWFTFSSVMSIRG
jgi:hypothetical protein